MGLTSTINLINNLSNSKSKKIAMNQKIENQEIKNKIDLLKLKEFEQKVDMQNYEMLQLMQKNENNKYVEQIEQENKILTRIIEALELENNLLKNQNAEIIKKLEKSKKPKPVKKQTKIAI